MTKFKPVVVIAEPKMPGAASVEERESNRTVARHATLVDEIDAAINEILKDKDLKAEWKRHHDPVFDEESQEGSITIDQVRLADMVKALAVDENGISTGKYPLIEQTLTQRIRQAVQAALRRTQEGVNQRRSRFSAA